MRMAKDINSLVKEILFYMCDKITLESIQPDDRGFNFRFSCVQKYFNHPDEIFSDGDDLSNFKKLNKKVDDKIIRQAINYAIEEKYIKNHLYNVAEEKQLTVLTLTHYGYSAALDYKKEHSFLGRIHKISLFLADVLTIKVALLSLVFLIAFAVLISGMNKQQVFNTILSFSD